MSPWWLWKKKVRQCGWLEDGSLNEADLHGANLQGARLTDANLEQASLQRANLQGARLADANLRGADLNDARLGPNTTLPDDTKWTPGTDMTRFTDPDHPDFWRSDHLYSPAYRGKGGD